MEAVKSIVQSLLGVAPCKQELSGWNSKRSVRDSVRLVHLDLSRDIILQLSVKATAEDASSDA